MSVVPRLHPTRETEAAPPSAEVIAHPQARVAARLLAERKELHPMLVRARAVAAHVLPTLGMVITLLLVWQMLCGSPESRLPSPLTVWEQSNDVILHPFKGVTIDALGLHIQESGDVGIAGHVLNSLGRVAIGYSIAAVLGVLLGTLIGQSVIAYRALDPLFQVLRTVPPLAWLPISLAVFQEARPSTVFLIAITAIWPIILNTAAGVQNIPPSYRNVARVLALTPIEYFFKIMLPATVPMMFTGLRIGVGMSWLAIVAAEMVQGGTGIGFFIWDSYNSSLLTDTIVALIWIGLVGFSLDRIVGWIGRRVARQA